MRRSGLSPLPAPWTFRCWDGRPGVLRPTELVAPGCGARCTVATVPSDAGLRRHRDRCWSQRADRRHGHGPRRPAGSVPGEEPLHRRDGLDHRADPWLPLRIGRVHPIPGAERDLRGSRARVLSHLRAGGPVGQHRRATTSPRSSCTRTRNACSSTSATRSASRRCWVWQKWPPGRRRRPGPSAASTCASPPRSLDEMWACAANEAEREAIRTAMFGSVMDVVDRFLPDRSKHAPVRSMLSFLAVNSTFRGPYSPGSALCLAFALASPGTATMSKVRGGLGTIADHLLALFERHGGELRRHVKVSGIVVDGGAVQRRRIRRRRGCHGPGRGLEPRSDRDLHPAGRPRRPSRVIRQPGRWPSITGRCISRRTSLSAGSPSTAPHTRR